MPSYCEIARGHPWHGPFHDNEHGFPVRDESALFERLVLEINQAGLSWLTVLKKRAGLRAAFDNFDVNAVAAYGARDRERLLGDAGVIRNRLKIGAVIENARRLQAMRTECGGFAAWLDSHHPLSREEWVRLFKRNFKFTGGEITHEFLMGTGYLPGAHAKDCPLYAEVAKQNPPWLRA